MSPKARNSILIGALMLAGCATGRPEGPVCGDMRIAPGARTSQALALDATDGPATDPTAMAIAERMMGWVRPALGLRLTDEPLTFEVVTLSAGGQYGAFGAGFMRGWAENPVNPRPERFDLATGVSAGGLIAPFVAAGPAFDPALEAIWRGLDDADLLERRSILTLPWWRSIYDLGPAERRVRESVGTLFDGLAGAAAENRHAMVGAVNLDNGAFEVFDLTADDIAGRKVADPEGCITQAVLASAAIPVGFPARVVDGHLYVDGGTRKHVFFEAVELARKMVEATGTPARINAYIVVNSDLAIAEAMPDANPLDAGLRAASIIIDETLRQSIVEAVAYAERDGWEVFGITAAGLDLKGPAPGKQFDGAFTARLFDAGRALAADPGFRWLTADELTALLRQPIGG